MTTNDASQTSAEALQSAADAEAAAGAVRSFFARGNQFFVSDAKAALVIDIVGSAMMAIKVEPGVGVLAQLAIDDVDASARMVFVPFAADNSTLFSRLPRGVYQYAVADANTEVHDLEFDDRKPVSVFDPQFTADLARMCNEAQERAAAAGQPPADAQTTGASDVSRQFAAGTIFTVAASDNPAVKRYIGKIFQSTHATAEGVMAIPDTNSDLQDAVFLPFDGMTDFTLNPAGTFTFASGVGSEQMVWNSQLQTYVTYDSIFPDYIPPAVIYYDPWCVPDGVAAGILVADVLLGSPYVGYGPGYASYDPYWW